MNSTLKTVLLTVLTLSVFTIALIEVSGVSEKNLRNKLGMADTKSAPRFTNDVKRNREEKMSLMPRTTMSVNDSLFDFGTITDGDVVQHTYLVKNEGDKPLFIANVQTSCGCTAPQFPDEPILPGAVGSVVLEFSSAGKEGHVVKKALIVANADNAPFPIAFEAQVNPKK